MKRLTALGTAIVIGAVTAITAPVIDTTVIATAMRVRSSAVSPQERSSVARSPPSRVTIAAEIRMFAGAMRATGHIARQTTPSSHTTDPVASAALPIERGRTTDLRGKFRKWLGLAAAQVLRPPM